MFPCSLVFHTATRKRKQNLMRKPEIVSCPQRSQKREGKYRFRPDPELQLSHCIITETFGNIFPTHFQFSPVLCGCSTQLFISWLQAGYTMRGHEGCSCSKQLCKSTSSAQPLCNPTLYLLYAIQDRLRRERLLISL